MSIKLKVVSIFIISMFSYMFFVFLFIKYEKSTFFIESNFLIFLFSLFLIISFLSYLCISSVIKKEFLVFEYKMNDFLEYINQNNYNCEEFDLKENNEFSKTLKNVNESIKYKKNNIKLEYDLLKDAIDVEKNLSCGDLSSVINLTSNNSSLNNLKDITNLMILKYENNISHILDVLEEFVMGNYLKRLDEKENSLHLNKLNTGINELADTITNLLIKNKTNAIRMQDESESFFRQMNIINKTCKESKTSFQNAGFILNQITSTMINTNDKALNLSSLANVLSLSIEKNESLIHDSCFKYDDLRVKINDVNNNMNKMDELVFKANLLINELNNKNDEKDEKFFIERFKDEAKQQVEEITKMKYLIKDCINIADEHFLINNNISSNFKKVKQNMLFSKKSINEFIRDKNDENRIIKNIKNISNVLNTQMVSSSKLAVKVRNVMYEKDILLSEIIKETNEKEFLGKYQKRKQYLIDSNNFKDLNKIFNVDEFKSRTRKKTVFI